MKLAPSDHGVEERDAGVLSVYEPARPLVLLLSVLVDASHLTHDLLAERVPDSRVVLTLVLDIEDEPLLTLTAPDDAEFFIGPLPIIAVPLLPMILMAFEPLVIDFWRTRVAVAG